MPASVERGVNYKSLAAGPRINLQSLKQESLEQKIQ